MNGKIIVKIWEGELSEYDNVIDVELGVFDMVNIVLRL